MNKNMIKKPTVCAIVAVGPDNVIGRGDGMPWYCPADYYHFRKKTIPYPCVFGRTTFENLPVRPLPDRFNLVCSSHYKNEYVDGVFYASSVGRAIAECKNYDQIFICGGAQIYKYSIDNDLIDIMYLTIIKNSMLESEIKQNPGAYCRFPFDVKKFLSLPEWKAKSIFYAPNELPKTDDKNICEFYECVRMRGV